ncbi:hypothetical protein LCGC14_1729380 [marine sediment metagenome]|uniref:Uncharacterized protein n=1 Tax=marine sediment metagenome TaxID=412755 RepID=A0A0F9HXV5_9ZZZZ
MPVTGISETDKVKTPLPDFPQKALRDGASHIDLNDYSKGRKPLPLAQVMLGPMLRHYIVRAVKAPLRKAIILAGKRLPKPTRENTYYHNTHVLMDIFDRFFERYYFNPNMDMMKAARDILLAEIEHDPHYRYLLNWLVQELAKEVNNDNWKSNDTEFPNPDSWKDKEE